MPTPNKNETEKDFVKRCIPIVLDDGTAADGAQATAICHSIFKKAQGKAIDMTDLEPEVKAVTKKEADGEHPSSHYLVVEDPSSPSTWHLRVKDPDGTPNHTLMGAAWAALHGGYRGNAYEGPKKGEAISKLTSLYKAEGIPTPAKSIDPDELKIGARHSGKDMEALQSIHDAAITLGAACPQPKQDLGILAAMYEPDKSLDFDPADEVTYYGGEVKALGDGKVGGYLVRFTSNQDPDLTGDFFTKNTEFDFEFPGQSTVYFNHGMDRKMGKHRLHKADLREDDFGVWAETILNERDEYEQFLSELAKAGKLGWSSGTNGYLVERHPEGKANMITYWPLGKDASLTHKPAESRNAVIPLKSLMSDLHITTDEAEEAGDASPITGSDTPNLPIKEFDDMDKEELLKLLDERDAARAAEVKAEADKAAALKAAEEAGYKKAQEELKIARRSGYSYHKESELGLKDDEVKSFLYWIKTGDEVAYKAAMQGQTDSEGGFAVPDDFYSRIIAKRSESSVIDQIGVTRIPTSLDRVLVPVEGTAATKFVVTAEEGAYDENEPTLGQVAITVHKLTKLVKISEELEADAKADFGGYLAGIWGRAMAAADNYYYVVSGSGGGEPQAMAVGGSLGRTATNAASLVAADIQALVYAMPDPYVAGMKLIMKRDVVGYVRSLLVATPYAFADWIGGNSANPTPPPIGTIAGVPVYTTAAMVGLTGGVPVTKTKTGLLVNPEFYAVVEREGMTVSRNPWLYQGNGQIGLFAHYRAGGAVLQSEAILWLIQA